MAAFISLQWLKTAVKKKNKTINRKPVKNSGGSFFQDFMMGVISCLASFAPQGTTCSQFVAARNPYPFEKNGPTKGRLARIGWAKNDP